MRRRARRFPPLLAAAGLLVTLAACTSAPEVRAPEPSGLPAPPPVTEEALPPVPPVPAVGSLATDPDPDVLFVDPVDGDDGADGQTSSRAWASLQYALDRLEPGDTLYLMGGEYRGDLTPDRSHFLLTASGRPDAWITVTAAPGQAPTLVATGGNGLEIRGDHVQVSGLEVVGEGFGPDNDYGWGLLTRGNHHVRLLGNEVSGMPVGGITSVEATNLEIVDNRVHDNAFWGPEQGSGISLWHSRDAGTEPAADGYHDRIIGNIVYRNENKVFSQWRDHEVITDGNGIIVDQADEMGYTGRILVANNLILDNGGRAVLVLESSRVDVVHNTTFHNGRTEGLEGGPAELVAGRAHDVRFLNNLAWSRPGAPAVVVRNASDVESGGNVYVSDTPSAVPTDADLVVTGDPGVRAAGLDPAVADFRPRPDSLLAARALTVSPALPVDADREPRPAVGATVGAYELVTS